MYVLINFLRAFDIFRAQLVIFNNNLKRETKLVEYSQQEQNSCTKFIFLAYIQTSKRLWLIQFAHAILDTHFSFETEKTDRTRIRKSYFQ